METTPNKSPRSSTEQQGYETETNPLDTELASAYVKNSEMSLEIAEEFAAMDQGEF